MQKKLLIIVAIALFSFNMPMAATTMMAEMGVAEQVEEPAPTISVEANTVSVYGGAGLTLEVVSLTGRAIASYKIEGSSQRFDLNLPKGCYILKVGKTVRKVTVR